MSPFRMRMAAVCLWFLGGLLSDSVVLGLMTMTSAALFGTAMFLDKEEDDSLREQSHKDGYFAAKRRILDLLEGRISVLDAKLENPIDNSPYSRAMARTERTHLQKARTAIRQYVLWSKEEMK